jgi:hypothetical protein
MNNEVHGSAMHPWSKALIELGHRLKVHRRRLVRLAQPAVTDLVESLDAWSSARTSRSLIQHGSREVVGVRSVPVALKQCGDV